MSCFYIYYLTFVHDIQSLYIYIYIYIYIRSICRQQLFRSLRAHQYISDAIKLKYFQAEILILKIYVVLLT